MASQEKAGEQAREASAALLARHAWIAPLGLAALCGLLYCWRLGVAPLRDFDEAYYAEGARRCSPAAISSRPTSTGSPSC